MTDQAQPTSQLADLLSTFGIRSVIAVDDEDRDSTIDSELQAGRIESGEITLDELFALDGVNDFINDRGVDQDDEERVREVIADGFRNGEISLGSPASDEGTASAFNVLRTILNDAGIQFDVKDFDEWETPSDVDPATFVLFDFRRGGEPVGAQLALAYAATHGDDARVAVLSQEPGDLRDLWAEHVAGADPVIARQVVWIAKASLTAQPTAIVEQIAIALSAPHLRRLQEEGIDLLQEAISETAAAAARLDPYELHHLTVGSASSDGGFEPESLITRFARRSLPAAVATMQLQTSIHTALSQLRQVHDSRIIAQDPTSNLIELQRDDYYIRRAQMVGRHQAASAGDIFALFSPELVAGVLSKTFDAGTDPLADHLDELADLQLYILVAQPCDLAVRPNGTRATRGRWLEALPVTASQDSDEDRASMGPGIHKRQPLFRLPWLAGAADSGHRRVTYKKVLSLPMLAVDACTWSAADVAALRVDDSIPQRLSLNWKARLESRTEEISRVERSCQIASSLGEDQTEVAERIRLDAAASNQTIGFHYNSANRSLAWGLVRVARLRSPYAESLLTAYNDFRRRDAFPAALA